MPELPEVQTVVDTIRPRLLRRRIRNVNVVRQDIIQPPNTNLAELLTGRTVANVTRRGKRIIIVLDDANAFIIHLGMTGRLTIAPPAEPISPHTHLLLELDSSPPAQLRFRDPRRFGGLWWIGPADGAHGMGPEPLKITPVQLAGRLAKTTRAIKNALLDQRLIAGLGNIYVDEALFAAGIHPLTAANTLQPVQVAKLNRAIKSILRRALRHRGSTLRDYRDANGLPGAFQKLHRVYARGGQPCWTCRTPLERIIIGGRSTHFCPNCQKP